MTAVEDAQIADSGADSLSRRRPILRRVLWISALSFGDLAVGPLLSVPVKHVLPPGITHGWTWLTLVAVAISAAALLACWLGLSILTEELFALDPKRCRLLVAIIWGPGSFPWLLPLSLSLPTHAATPTEAVAVAAMITPSALIAISVCPGIRRPYRLIPLVACTTLAASWPALSTQLVHNAANQQRALGAPASMYLVVNVPGHVPYQYQYTNQVLQTDYEAPGLSSPMRDTDDLLLTVCPASDPTACQWGQPTITTGNAHLSCNPEPGDLWRCTDEYADTTLAARYDGLYVSLAVDPTSDTPVPAAQLPAILKTLHTATDRELLTITTG